MEATFSSVGHDWSSYRGAIKRRGKRRKSMWRHQDAEAKPSNTDTDVQPPMRPHSSQIITTCRRTHTHTEPTTTTVPHSLFPQVCGMLLRSSKNGFQEDSQALAHTLQHTPLHISGIPTGMRRVAGVRVRTVREHSIKRSRLFS